MAVSNTRGRGNIPTDDYNIDWMMHNGGLEEIDYEEEGIDFKTRFRWNGSKDTEGSPWAIPPLDRRCTGRSFIRDSEGDYVVDQDNRRIRRPCLNWPMRGTHVCVVHGGKVPAVRRAAVIRLISSLDAVVGKHLSIIFSKSSTDADKMKAIRELYEVTGVKKPQQVEVRAPGWERVIEKMFMDPNNPTVIEGHAEEEE